MNPPHPPTHTHTHTHTHIPISITDSLYLCIRCVCIWICPLCSDWASWGHALVGKFHQGEVSASAWGRGDQASLIKGFLSHGLRWVLLREGPSAKSTWLGVNRQGTYPIWPLTSHWASRKWERFERHGCLIIRNVEAGMVGCCSEMLKKGTSSG